MKKSKYDILRDKISKALKEYSTYFPDHRVDVRLSVSHPGDDSGSTGSYSDFLSGNVVHEHIELMNDHSRRPDEPSELLQEDIMALANSGDQSGAIELAEYIVKTYGSNPRARLWLGETYESSGMREAGLQALHEALQLAESREWLLNHDVAAAIEIRYTLGQIYILSNQAQVGMEQLNTALRIARDAGLSDKAQFVASLVEQYKGAQ